MSRPIPGFADYALLALLSAMWGGSFMLIKLAVDDVPPATMTFARLLIAAVILFAFAMAYRDRMTIGFSAVGWVILTGFFGNALPFTLIAWGEMTVDASLTGILMGIMPISTLLLVHFLPEDEVLTSRKLIGCLIGLAGLVVLVGPAVLLRLGDDGIRQLAILGAAVSYSVNAIVMKKLLNLPRRPAAAFISLAGALIMLPIAFLTENPTALAPDTLPLISVLLLGIFPTAVATLVMFEVLQRQGAAFFGQVNFIVPVFAIAWAAVFLGERPELSAYVALGFILSGIWIARGRAMPRAKVSS